MPLVRYEVRSEYGLANAELYQSVPEDDPEGLVEAVAMAGLVGVVRQLGDMAEFAAELFHQLHEEVMSTAARGHGLLARVQQLEAELPTFEKTLATQTKQLQFAYTQGMEFHAAIRNDQNHLTQGDLPRFVRNSYDECRAPPRLFLLDKFDMNGAGACLKRYTDPSFFKREWASSELFKAEKDIQDRKARRIKRKGFGHSTGETRNTVSMPQIRSRVPFSLLDMENLTSTSRNMENLTSTSRNMENRTSTSRNMENLTSTSQNMENLASTSQDMENLANTSHTTSEDLKPIYESDMATVSSALNETSGKAPSVMREDVADQPQTDAHVIQVPWKADNMGFSDNSTVGEANVAPIDDVQSETDINDAGDRKAMEKNDQSEENGLQKVVELLEEQQQIPPEEEHDQTVEAMESEPEQFVDALGTMDSEVETDTESKSKVDVELFSDARDGEGSVKSSYSEWYSDAWEGEGSTRVTSGDLSADAKGEDSVISTHSALDSSVPSKHNFNVEKDLISIQPTMDDLEPLEMRGRNISSSPSSVTSSFSSAEDDRSVPPVHVQLEHEPSPPKNGDDFKSQMQAVSSLLDDLNDSASEDHVSETLSSCSEHGDDFSSSFHLLPEPAIPLSNGSEPGKIKNLGALSLHRRESADLEKNGDDGPKSVLSETEEILSQTSLADSFDMPLPMQAESTDDDNGDDIDGDGIDMNDGDVTEGSDIDALEIGSKSSSSSPSMFSSPRVLAPIKNNRSLPSHSSIHSPFSSESSLRSFPVLKDLHSPRPSVKLGGDGLVPSSEDSEPEGIMHVQTDASNASSPLLESKITLDESLIFEPTSLPTIKVVAEEHPIPESSLGTEKSLKESPPLPPLPPLKWRVMKPRADAQSPSSAGSIKEDLASAMPSDSGTNTSTPFMPFTARGSTMPPSSQPNETAQWRPAVHVVERTNSLVEAIPSHDRNMLRKAASQNHLPRPKPSDERVSLLEQIRAKSFSLRRTVIEKHGAPPPVTSINVAAILEKANAIRQAFAGSDDDEDDDDDWNDN